MRAIVAKCIRAVSDARDVMTHVLEFLDGHNGILHSVEQCGLVSRRTSFWGSKTSRWSDSLLGGGRAIDSVVVPHLRFCAWVLTTEILWGFIVRH